MLHLAKGHKPRRPQSHPIDDQHWEFIEYCWSPIQERPCAERLTSSILNFLRYQRPPLAFCSMLVSPEKSTSQSTLGNLLSPSNVEQFLPDAPQGDDSFISSGPQLYTVPTTPISDEGTSQVVPFQPALEYQGEIINIILFLGIRPYLFFVICAFCLRNSLIAKRSTAASVNTPMGCASSAS